MNFASPRVLMAISFRMAQLLAMATVHWLLSIAQRSVGAALNQLQIGGRDAAVRGEDQPYLLCPEQHLCRIDPQAKLIPRSRMREAQRCRCRRMLQSKSCQAGVAGRLLLFHLLEHLLLCRQGGHHRVDMRWRERAARAGAVGRGRWCVATGRLLLSAGHLAPANPRNGVESMDIKMD